MDPPRFGVVAALLQKTCVTELRKLCQDHGMEAKGSVQNLKLKLVDAITREVGGVTRDFDLGDLVVVAGHSVTKQHRRWRQHLRPRPQWELPLLPWPSKLQLMKPKLHRP